MPHSHVSLQPHEAFRLLVEPDVVTEVCLHRSGVSAQPSMMSNHYRLKLDFSLAAAQCKVSTTSTCSTSSSDCSTVWTLCLSCASVICLILLLLSVDQVSFLQSFCCCSLPVNSLSVCGLFFILSVSCFTSGCLSLCCDS